MTARTFEDLTFTPDSVPLYPFSGIKESEQWKAIDETIGDVQWSRFGSQERASFKRATVRLALVTEASREKNRGKIVIEIEGVCQILEVFAAATYFQFLETEYSYRPRIRPENKPNILFPIDPRMTEEDIEGATLWYPNATNTGWLFGHCDRDFHLDYEYHLTSALNSTFAREKDLTHDASDSALYSVLLNNTSDTRHEWGRKTRVLDNLRKFHAQTELELLKEHKAHPVGYYQRNPHAAHLHEPILRAIRKVETVWAEDTEQAIHWRDLKPVVARICLLYTSPSPRDS